MHNFQFGPITARRLLERHVTFLIRQYSLDGVLHAMIEACYMRAEEQSRDGGDCGGEWRQVARELTTVELRRIRGVLVLEPVKEVPSEP